jgi:transketolase
VGQASKPESVRESGESDADAKVWMEKIHPMNMEDPPTKSDEEVPIPQKTERKWRLRTGQTDEDLVNEATRHTRRELFPDLLECDPKLRRKTPDLAEPVHKGKESPHQESESEVEDKKSGEKGTFKD